jgi:hypothetical protein
MFSVCLVQQAFLFSKYMNQPIHCYKMLMSDPRAQPGILRITD